MQTMFQKGMLEMSQELMSWLSLLCEPNTEKCSILIPLELIK